MDLLELQRENEALKRENEALKNEALKLKFVKVIDLICENGELKESNAELKLKLFWKEYSPEKLKEAICSANYVEGGYWCCCLACAVSGRHDKGYGETDENKPCTFKPWFEQMLGEHDMSIGYGIPDVPMWVDGSVVDSHNNVLDDGHHFSNLARQDWVCWTYGSRLWNTTSVRDPELAKLERLFETLDTLDDGQRLWTEKGKNKRVTSKKKHVSQVLGTGEKWAR